MIDLLNSRSRNYNWLVCYYKFIAIIAFDRRTQKPENRRSHTKQFAQFYVGSECMWVFLWCNHFGVFTPYAEHNPFTLQTHAHTQGSKCHLLLLRTLYSLDNVPTSIYLNIIRYAFRLTHPIPSELRRRMPEWLTRASSDDHIKNYKWLSRETCECCACAVLSFWLIELIFKLNDLWCVCESVLCSCVLCSVNECVHILWSCE